MNNGIFVPAVGGGGLGLAAVTEERRSLPHLLVIAKEGEKAIELRLDAASAMALADALHGIASRVWNKQLTLDAEGPVPHPLLETP